MDQNRIKYEKQWDSYWRQIVGNDQHNSVVWETAPERSAWEDMKRFQPYINENLPLLDLGCGSGKQTRFLARYFRRVIGVDVSPAVVEYAQRTTEDINSNVEWRVFNALDIKGAEALHAEFGDMNIYMRGVLHLIEERDRPNFVSTLEILLGTLGTLYLIEIRRVEGGTYLHLVNRDGSLRFPELVRSIGFNNIRDRVMYFPDDQWELLDAGENVGLSTIKLKDGKEGLLPADYLILRNRL